MKKVVLYGELGRKYGKFYRFDVHTPGEAMQALMANFPDFYAYLRESAEKGVQYRVYIGHTLVTDVKEGAFPLSDREPIRLVPAPSGASGNQGLGALEFVIGAAITVFSGGTLANIGVPLMIGGMALMLTSTPKKPDQATNTPSFFFGGVENVTAQGGCVPICYGGPIMVGSVVISSGLFTQDF